MNSKRRAAATAVAAVTSAGVVVGGAFPAPQDLLRDDDGGQAPAPITEMLYNDAAIDDVDDTDDDTEDEDEERRRSSPGSRIRAWTMGLPLAVRAGVGVPLWCVGWLVLTGLSAVWSVLLSPLLGTVAGWVATALVLLAVFVLTVKAAFPGLPLKKIVNKRTFLGLLLGTAAIALADAVLPLFLDNYGRIAALVRALASAGLLGTVTAVFLRREKKRAAKLTAAAPAEEEPEEEEPLEVRQARALQLVRELVDQVSPRKRGI